MNEKNNEKLEDAREEDLRTEHENEWGDIDGH